MYQIQKATPEHLDEIVSLWLKLMKLHKGFDPYYFSGTDDAKQGYKEDIEWFINNDSNKVYVALINNKVVGYVTAQLYFPLIYSRYNRNTHCSIEDIMIDEEYHHLSIGKAFVEEVKLWSQSFGIKTIQLNVFSKNKNALEFFKALGFDELFHKLELKINKDE